MNRKLKKINVTELKELGIANNRGVIDYKKYSKFKATQRSLGYNVRLNIDEEHTEEGRLTLDNEPTKYGDKLHTHKINIIE
ncbi:MULTISPECIES: hypothetical protein [Mammaliicoccus]|uniref:hypothetical protein n=1 Tax=Mammaliicoccus TaxID=2803850 RepID=UPI001EFC3A04|nr:MULTISPECIES: hypothetical protein [Mammaliicoccus]MCE5086094.1 hypothetical protein [Mammaliicoccus sciuri]